MVSTDRLRDIEGDLESPHASINLPLLRSVVQRLLECIEEELYGSEAPIVQEYYWTVCDDDVLNLERAPEGLIVGSLVDDWQAVLVAEDISRAPCPELLNRVASLLRALSLMRAPQQRSNFKA